MANKTIIELNEVGAFDPALTYLAVDDGTQTFKAKLTTVVPREKQATFSHNLTGDLGVVGQNYGTFTVPAGVTSVDVEVVKRAPPFANSGYAGAMVLMEGGNAVGTGYNDKGQLGNGGIVNQSAMSLWGTFRAWKNIAFTLLGTSRPTRYGLDENNFVWVWGDNLSGQAGIGTAVNVTVPTIQSARQWAQVFGGYYNGWGLTTNGDLYYFGGTNTDGSGGFGGVPATAVSVPQLVPAPGVIERYRDVKTAYVSGISPTTYALTTFGNVYAWGNNNGGQLANGNTTNQSTPVKVQGTQKFVAIGPGKAATNGINDGPICAGLTPTGQMYIWGKCQNGQAGNGVVNVTQTSPVLVASGNHTFEKMITSQWAAHLGGIKANGDAYLWGENSVGEIGDGTTVVKSTPTLIPGGLKWKDIVVGQQTTYGITRDGKLYAWGRATEGQLGDGTIVNKSTPTLLLGGLDGWEGVIVANSLNEYIVYGARDGKLYTWGNNNLGALGQNSATANFSVPTLVTTNSLTPRVTPEVWRRRIKVTPGDVIKVQLEPFLAKFGNEVVAPERCDEMNIYYEQ